MAKTIYNHFGKIVNGQRLYYNPKLLQQTLSELEGKEFVEVIKEKYKKVSLDTHGYYRGGIIKECLKYEIFGGWSEDDIHDFFADMFLKEHRMLELNREGNVRQLIARIRSTASLSQKEMNEYIEKVIAWLSNEGIVIHSPEDYFLGKYKSEDNGEQGEIQDNQV